MYTGRSIKNFYQYALGNRDFTNFSLIFTILATWIGGNSLFLITGKSYSEGPWFTIAILADVINFFIVAYIFAPLMAPFLGRYSSADLLGSIYGKNVRVVTSISSILISIGWVACQIKVLTFIFESFNICDNSLAIVISSIIIITYSAFGGIRSVVCTDILQFVTMMIALFILIFLVWNYVSELKHIKQNLNIIYAKIDRIDLQNKYSALFLYFLIPVLNPTTMHRLLIAKDAKQIINTFSISGVIYLLFVLAASAIGLIMSTYHSQLDENLLIIHLVKQSAKPGIIGIVIIGIIAMIASTADSFINSAAITFTHDLAPILSKKYLGRLKTSRLVSFIIGVSALFLSLTYNDLLELLMVTNALYIPIVTMPLICTIMGFRTTSKVILVGMLNGALFTIAWNIYLQDITEIDGILPGAFANIATMLLIHSIQQATLE